MSADQLGQEGFQFDRSGLPLHLQVRDRLFELIVHRRLAVGSQLSSERELASQLGVSRMTLRHALALLERQGLIHRQVGRKGGTFVAAAKVEMNLSAFAGLTEHLHRHGMMAGARVLTATEQLPAVEARAALGLELDETVYEIVRIRLADGDPVALERSAFPSRRFPGLLERPLDGSLYALLGEHYGQFPVRALERLEPIVADDEQAEALKVARHSPLMMVERTAFSSAGTPVEFAHDIFRGDRISMVVWSSFISAPAAVADLALNR